MNIYLNTPAVTVKRNNKTVGETLILWAKMFGHGWLNAFENYSLEISQSNDISRVNELALRMSKSLESQNGEYSNFAKIDDENRYEFSSEFGCVCYTAGNNIRFSISEVYDNIRRTTLTVSNQYDVVVYTVDLAGNNLQFYLNLSAIREEKDVSIIQGSLKTMRDILLNIVGVETHEKIAPHSILIFLLKKKIFM